MQLDPQAVQEAIAEARDKPMVIQCVGARLDGMYRDMMAIQNLLFVAREKKLQGRHAWDATTLVAKLRQAADELEGLIEERVVAEAAE